MLRQRQDARVFQACPAKKSRSETLEGIADANAIVIQIELGTACGKLFRCSTMAIIDAGDSDILSSQTT